MLTCRVKRVAVTQVPDQQLYRIVSGCETIIATLCETIAYPRGYVNPDMTA